MSVSLKRATCAAIVALLATTSVAPAVAQSRYHSRDAYMEHYYRSHQHDSDYRRWRDNRHRWDRRDYDRWYRSHRKRDGDDIAAAAIFGLAAGAIAAGVAANASQPRSSGVPSAGGYPYGSDGYYRYCSRKYRSFDPRSGTYLGYDGQRHYCQ